MKTYRDYIYERYVSGFLRRSAETDNKSLSAKQVRAFDWYLRKWMPVDRGSLILDAGCGGGNLLAYFRRRGYLNLRGVDISPEQVCLARRVTSAVQQTNILEYLDTTAEQFDLVTAMDVVEHFTKDELLRFLELCRKVIKPAGRIIIQTPNPGSPFGGEVRYGDLTHEQALVPTLLSRLLAFKGFEHVECRESGPVPVSGPIGAIRYALWRLFRAGLGLWDIVECGGHCRIYTRVFLCSAQKRGKGESTAS